MIPLIVIAGPTASGKTAFAVELALKLGGEIVSADSMQVYKYMDIGTAKPDMEERKGIAHHLIDIALPTQPFSVASYKELAQSSIADIYKRGKLPILAGGTGLYINTVIDNITLSPIVSDQDLRQELTATAKDRGNTYLHMLLKEMDPSAAEKLHENDIRRVIRAIEVYKLTGESILLHNKRSRGQSSDYKLCYIALNMDRTALYDRINKRVDIMFEAGLVKEVEELIKMGCNKTHTSMQAIGYKEVQDALEGSITMEQAIDNIKQESRHYAKRQLTWFKKDERINWLNSENNTHLIEEGFKYINSLHIMKI